MNKRIDGCKALIDENAQSEQRRTSDAMLAVDEDAPALL